MAKFFTTLRRERFLKYTPQFSNLWETLMNYILPNQIQLYFIN